MVKVKWAAASRRRRRKVLKSAKGYFGGRHRLYRTAKETVMRALAYATRDRRQKKREFRYLWIARINAACKEKGISYSRFISGLKKAQVALNRKVLAELAVHEPAAFANLVELVKGSAEPKPKAKKALKYR